MSLAAAPEGGGTPSARAPLERARTVCGLVRDEALASERLGRLTDKVADALLQAKLFSVLVPPTAGGLGGTRLDLFHSVEAIAGADGSAGWCVSACNTVNHMAFEGLGAEGRHEVFGHGPVACWTALAPRAVASRVAGGYRVSGHWTFGSGSSLSRWALVSGPPPDKVGPSLYRAYVVPKSDIEIIEGSWDVMGLRATASLDYAIADAFVPEHRSFLLPFASEAPPEAVSVRDGGRLNLVGLTAFACGVGQEALNALIAEAPGIKRMSAEASLADDHRIQFGVGELDGRLRAARAHFTQLVARQDERLAQGGLIDAEMGHQFAQAAHTLTRAARDAALFAFDCAGASAVYADHPLQRRLRDILTGLKHASFTPAILGRIGKVRLGLEYGARAF